VLLGGLRGRAALAAAAEPFAKRERLHREVEEIAHSFEREGSPWATAEMRALRAGLLAQRGDERGALAALLRANADFEAADMHLHATFARRLSGLLLGGEAGQKQKEAAEETLRELGIVNPAAWTQLLLPGFSAKPPSDGRP
jgi:hypothetical protein